MRKITFALTLLPFAAVPTHAAPALVQIGVGQCCMVDGDGTPFCTPNPSVKVKVATQSDTSALILNCHVDGVPNHTGSAVTYNAGNTGGAQCNITDPLLGYPVATSRWQSVVSAGGANAAGSADLICQFHAPSGQ
jgi:hypothetical protein